MYLLKPLDRLLGVKSVYVWATTSMIDYVPAVRRLEKALKAELREGGLKVVDHPESACVVRVHVVSFPKPSRTYRTVGYRFPVDVEPGEHVFILIAMKKGPDALKTIGRITADAGDWDMQKIARMLARPLMS
jgi:hypothetical protein